MTEYLLIHAAILAVPLLLMVVVLHRMFVVIERVAFSSMFLPLIGHNIYLSLRLSGKWTHPAFYRVYQVSTIRQEVCLGLAYSPITEEPGSEPEWFHTSRIRPLAEGSRLHVAVPPKENAG